MAEEVQPRTEQRLVIFHRLFFAYLFKVNRYFAGNAKTLGPHQLKVVFDPCMTPALVLKL